MWTSLVSALAILSPQPILHPNAEPNSLSELSRNISAHTETNASLLSLPSGGVLSNTSHLNFSGPPYIFCDESLGVVNVQACEDALAHAMIGHDTNLRTWGPRGANNYEIGLPKLYMSSDGTCGIFPQLRQGKTSATVTPSVALHVAERVVRTCVGGNPSTGGYAESIGGDDNLLMYVMEYAPEFYAENVQCLGPTSGGSGIVNGCNRLADLMSASKERKDFGPQIQSPDYHTPYRVSQPHNPCYVEVTSHPNNRLSIEASWLEIYEAVVMVNAMCIRSGRQGKYTIVSWEGEEHWLEIEVGEVPAQGNNLTLLRTSE